MTVLLVISRLTFVVGLSIAMDKIISRQGQHLKYKNRIDKYYIYYK